MKLPTMMEVLEAFLQGCWTGLKFWGMVALWMAKAVLVLAVVASVLFTVVGIPVLRIGSGTRMSLE